MKLRCCRGGHLCILIRENVGLVVGRVVNHRQGGGRRRGRRRRAGGGRPVATLAADNANAGAVVVASATVDESHRREANS